MRKVDKERRVKRDGLNISHGSSADSRLLCDLRSSRRPELFGQER